MRIILLLVFTSISACQGSTGQPASPGPNATNLDSGTSTPNGTDGASEPVATPESTLLPGQPDMSWIFDIPADPASVDVALEAENTVTATVPITGGTLSVTGADGTVYTLEIPPNALFAPTTIGMTPAISVAGLPFGGQQTYAVQFSPEGQFFYTDAILTITPTEPIPVEEQLVFGYEGEGEDLILAAPVVESTEIKILVNHFSGNGVTKGLLADLEPARERVGGSAERRIENAMNAELARQRQQALAGTGQQDLAQAAANRAALQAILDQYEKEVVKPRVDAAGESCAAGQVAVESVLRLARMRALMGLDGGEGGDPLAKYPGLLEKAAQVCVVEEFELCVEEHIIHRMVPVWLGFERQFALYGKGDAAVLREARDLTVACLTFDLEFESTGRLNVAAGGYESTVSSTIKLRFNPEDFTISGVAPLDNDEFDYTMPRCDVTSVPGGGEFEIFKLIPLDVPDAGYGSVRDLILTYVPGSTSESVSWVCNAPGGGTLKGSLPAFPAWTGTFIGTHQDELNTDTSPPPAGDITYLSEMPPGGGYTATDWEILAGEHFASKEWSESAGQLVEEGSFELYHRPSR